MDVVESEAALVVARDETRDLGRTLDQLIPPPGSIAKRLVSGVCVVALAVALTFVNMSGWLYPRPTFGGNASSGTFLVVDQQQQWVTTSVVMPNHSSRSVRMTAIDLDASGVALVGSGVIVEPANGPTMADEASGDFAVDEVSEAMSPEEMFAPEVGSLPVTIEPGETARVFVRFRPTDCTNVVDPIGTWGVALVSLDFGDGSFPPFGRTVGLGDDPIIANGEQPQLIRADGSIINITVDGQPVDAGILTATCDALS